MTGFRLHSDSSVDLGSSLHDDLSVHDRLAEGEHVGFGSLIQVNDVFGRTFHAVGRTAHVMFSAAHAAGKAARTVDEGRRLTTGGASVDSERSRDAETTVSARAQDWTRRGTGMAGRGAARTLKAGNTGYEAARRGVYRVQKAHDPNAERSLLPKSVPQQARAMRDRHRENHMMRKAARQDRRMVRRSKPATTKAGQTARKTARTVRRMAVRAQNTVRRVSWAALSAPCLGIVVLIVVLVSCLGMTASASECGNSPSSSSGSMTDDYYYGPHGKEPHAANSGMSPMGYEYGNCTDFVAWRVNRDNGASKPPWKYRHDLTPKGGDGKQWGDDGNLPGWKMVSHASTVSPGDIVSYMPGVDGADATHGHVAYVGSVSTTSITTENYSNGRYYQEKIPNGSLQKWIDSDGVVVKHNPKGVSSSSSSAAGCDVGGGASAGASTQDVAEAKAYAKQYLNGDEDKFAAVDHIYTHESGWRWNAQNPTSPAYGIPQSNPGSKMKSEGDDWKTNAKTQVRWGIKYMRSRYGGEQQAWAYWQVHHNY